MQTLRILKKGKIHHIEDHNLARKLFSMGVLPGMYIEVKRVGLFGSTMYCVVEQNRRIALRESEVKSIFVD